MMVFGFGLLLAAGRRAGRPISPNPRAAFGAWSASSWTSTSPELGQAPAALGRVVGEQDIVESLSDRRGNRVFAELDRRQLRFAVAAVFRAEGVGEQGQGVRPPAARTISYDSASLAETVCRGPSSFR